MKQTYKEFMAITKRNKDTYNYLDFLYKTIPRYKDRDFYALEVGEIFYGFRDEDINKYLVKQEAKTYKKRYD